MRPDFRRFLRIRTLAAAFLLALSLVRPAAADDLTDLWYAVGENAWGVNFVQSSNFMFATFFIYGPDGKPTWYTGQMTQDASGVWSGNVYLSGGTYFGSPWSESQKTIEQVGTITFTPASASAGALKYNVNTVSVAKQLTRLTLTAIPLGGSYSGAIISNVTSCSNPSNNGSARVFVDAVVTHITGGKLTFDFTVSGGGTCRLEGAFVQEGQVYRIPDGTYVCGTTFSATAQLSRIKATGEGIEGQWSAGVGGGCQEAGYFSAVLQ